MKDTKVCNICKIEKAVDQFSFKHKPTNKRQSHCKLCQNVRSKKHYEANKVDYIDRATDRKKDISNYLQNLKKSLSCSKCDESHSACLEFHHINPSTKLGTVASFVTFGSIKKLQEEIDKCIVLCANCHRKLHCKDIK